MRLPFLPRRWRRVPQAVYSQDSSPGGGDDKRFPASGEQDSRDFPPRGQRPEEGPPDLDELWQDFSEKLGGFFGQSGRKTRRGHRGSGGGGGGGGGPSLPNFQPSKKGTVLGIVTMLIVASVLWLLSGFFMVHEGDRGVITTFGKFTDVRTSGLNWRWPSPIQRVDIIRFSQIRSVDVGGNKIIDSTSLRESGMLTRDENIVEVKFAVQYRLDSPELYVFETKDPDEAVVLVAESAIREVVGRMTMDEALSDGRDRISPEVRTSMQRILDHYKTGVQVVAVNLEQGGSRPPEQVKAAFDDVIKAEQERERIKNEAQAYANDVVPRAQGTAARLREEAAGYKARIIAQADGDSERFMSVLTEYEKAPRVTRDRMYIDAMQEIYAGASKVLVDSKSGSNLMYLPLDELMKKSARTSGAERSSGAAAAPPAPPLEDAVKEAVQPPVRTDISAGSSGRTRDASRSRDSDFR